MTTLHRENREISCVHHTVRRHGGRRRRCADCGATWSVWKHRRGRKPRARRLRRLRRTFIHGFSVRQQAFLSGLDYEVAKARHRRMLKMVSHRSWPTPHLRGQLILLLDGLWFRIMNERWIVYLLALRSVSGKTAHFLRPIVCREHESVNGWRQALGELPPSPKKRICALVSDGLRGIRGLAKERGWRYQWCHFHLLGRMANVFGTRKRTVSWLNGRRLAEACIREIISTPSERRVRVLSRKLAQLARDPACPRKIRMMIREVLRHTEELRTYLDYPDLRLPATSNVMESLNSRLRSLAGRSRGFRTGEALERWIVTYVYFNSKSKCQPKIPQN